MNVLTKTILPVYTKNGNRPVRGRPHAIFQFQGGIVFGDAESVEKEAFDHTEGDI